MNNCPIAAIKTTLYKDSVTGKKVFTNEFKNIGDKVVNSYSVKISCFDENIKLVGTIKDYKYDSIHLAPGDEYGQNKIIACPSDIISSFAVSINHVEMEDEFYWDISEKKVCNHRDEVVVEVEMAPELPEEVVEEPHIESSPVMIETPVSRPVTDIKTQEPVPTEKKEEKSQYTIPEVVEENLFPTLGNFYETGALPNLSVLGDNLGSLYETANTSSNYNSLPSAYPQKTETVSDDSSYRTLSDTKVVEPVVAEPEVKAEEPVAVEPMVRVEEPVVAKPEGKEEEPAVTEPTIKEEEPAVTESTIKEEEPVVTESVVKEEESVATEPETKTISIQIDQNEPKQILAEDENEEDSGSKKNKIKKNKIKKNKKNKEVYPGNPDDPEEPDSEKKAKLPGPVKVLILVAVLGALGFAAYFGIKNYQLISKYNQGVEYFNNGKYEDAITAFSIVGNYKDAPNMLVKSQDSLKDKMLKQAELYLSDKKYTEALTIFNQYGNDESKVVACYEGLIDSAIENGEIDNASNYMNEAVTKNLSVDKTIQMKLNYHLAKIALENKEYEKVIELIGKNTKYEDSEKLIKEAYYERAKHELEIQEYEKAIEDFEKVLDYKDSQEKVLSAYYAIAERCVSYSDFENAVKYFELAGDYQDSKEKINDCYYQCGNQFFAGGKYKEAMEVYQKAGEYLDAVDLYHKTVYQYCLEEMEKAVTPEILELMGTLPKNYEDSATIVRSLKMYVDYVGEFEWTTSYDKELNARGGFSEHLFVTLTYDSGQIILKVNEYPIDLKTKKYDSKTDSDTYTFVNSSTITRTFNGKLSTYKKVAKK